MIRDVVIRGNAADEDVHVKLQGAQPHADKKDHARNAKLKVTHQMLCTKDVWSKVLAMPFCAVCSAPALSL